MRILFVDDEQLVLDAITRSLFHVDGWEVECATSGAEALEILSEGERFDVIVSDMRMPGMDGAELLTRVLRDHPDTVRMVLSGHTEQEAAMRTIGVAHQFLAKPCGAGVLQRAIERTLELQTLLGSAAVRGLVDRVPALPAAPATYTQLSRVLAEPDVDLAEVTRVVESDPGLCAKLLQVVNSAFFAQSEPTTEVHAAVVKLGVNTLKGLILSLEVMGKLQPKQPLPGFSFDQERAHATQVARLAATLYRRTSQRAAAFMAAILHDVGKWVLASEAPDVLTQSMALAREEQIRVFEAEKRLFGTTHAEVGAYLLGLWCLPEDVVAAVAHHHEPHRVPVEDGKLDVAHAVYIADGVLRGIGFDDERLKAIGCDVGIKELEARVEQQMKV